MDLDAMEKAAQERIAAYAARSAGQHAMHIRRDLDRRIWPFHADTIGAA